MSEVQEPLHRPPAEGGSGQAGQQADRALARGRREAGSSEAGGAETRREAQDRWRGAASGSRGGTGCRGGTVIVPRSRLARFAGSGGASGSDRKSTRLNSSHT